MFKPVGTVALDALSIFIYTSMIGCCACDKFDATRELDNNLAITHWPNA